MKAYIKWTGDQLACVECECGYDDLMVGVEGPVMCPSCQRWWKLSWDIRLMEVTDPDELLDKIEEEATDRGS